MTDDRPTLAVPPIRGTTAVMNSHPPFGVPWSSPAAAGFDPTRFARVLNRAQSLGSEGLVSPVLAAWAPSIVAILLGSTVLLFREDG